MSSLNAALAGVRDQIQSSRSSTTEEVVEPVKAKKAKAALVDSYDSDEDDDRNPNPSIDENAPILVFCRIRPSRGAGVSKEVLAVDADERRVEFKIPRAVDPGAPSGQPNNTKESFKFNFNGLFDQSTTQEQIFDGIAKRVVDNVIEGYNGTIFAYGQTGSGKTYSMMGGTDHYDDRGIIPRALTYIFDWIQEHAAEFSVTVRISYLEIYNDKGYDLLDPQHEHKSLEDLPRVTLMESDGSIFFRNLGELPAANVDEALNLLFVGDTNRVVCETPSNDASTRSHCIFMISLESRSLGSAVSTIRRSKLNLVDLAGSERIKKTGVGGKIRSEALHINVSLHFLEQVIVALHDASNGKSTHIPYRNSLLTSVLRDSLGGNCKTVMIATLSPERGHLDESISTSRFAQRVGQIKNNAKLNEEIDPYAMVARLKGTVREMREELAALRGQAKFRPVDDEDRTKIRELVRAFLRDDRDPVHFDDDRSGKFDQIPMPNPYRVRAAFEAWKEVQTDGGGGGGGPQSSTALTTKSAPSLVVTEDVSRLQRENSMLLDLLRKASGATQEQADSLAKEIRARAAKGQTVPPTTLAANGGGNTSGSADGGGRNPDRSSKSDRHPSSSAAAPPSSAQPQPAAPPVRTAAELALDKLRADSFESFRRSYRRHALIEEQKMVHAQKVDEARKIGERINQVRGEIEKTKSKMEQHRLTRGVQNLGDHTASEAELPEPDSKELELRSHIDSLKSAYRSSFDGLKRLKQEIDYLKNVVEKSRAQLQADFERWWATQPQAQQAAADGTGGGNGTTAIAPPAAALEPTAATARPDSRSRSSASRSSSSSHPPSSSSSSSRTGGLIAESAAIAANSHAMATSAGPRAAPVNAWGAGPAAPISHASTGGGSGGASGSAMPGGLRTTGNSAADADIARFYAMKEEMLRQRQQQQQQ